jgi:hypothetical protein
MKNPLPLLKKRIRTSDFAFFFFRALCSLVLMLPGLLPVSSLLAAPAFDRMATGPQTSGFIDVYGGSSFLSPLTISKSIGVPPPITASDKTLGGSGYEVFKAVIKTTDGGYLYSGSSASGAGGEKSEGKKGNDDEFNYDYWVVKVNSAGVKEWDRTYGGPGYDGFTTLTQTPDGGYLLGGYSWSEAGADKSEGTRGHSDFWIVKITGEGQPEWDRTYGGTDLDFLVSITLAPDGGYLLSGESGSESGADKTAESRGGNDFWVIKIGADGQPEWDRAYGGPEGEWLSAALPAADGGYVLAGYSTSGVGGEKSEGRKGEKRYSDGDYWVLKIDSRGTKQWDRTYGRSGADELKAAIQTADGGYLLGGFTEVLASGSAPSDPDEEDWVENTDYWIVKVTAAGVQEWEQTYGGNDRDDLAALISTAEGGFLLGGSSSSGANGSKTEPSRGGSDYWAVKVNNSGTKEWDRTFGGAYSDELQALLQTPEGAFLLGGNSSSGKSGDKTEESRGENDFWVVRLAMQPTTPPDPVTPTTGALLREHWAGVPGRKVSDIPLDTPPTSTSYLKVFESPSNIGDHYGARIRGYVHPPQTGYYVFSIAGDDNCELYLSPNQNPAAKKKIASVGSYTGSRQWSKYASQKSKPVRLKAGKRYYIEVLHKENTGKDHVAVAWTMPNGTLEAPIPGNRLSPYRPTEKKGDSKQSPLQELAANGALTAYPNPFTDRTTLSFSLTETGPATLEVYDLNGRLVRQLFAGEAAAGEQRQLPFEGRELARGIYIARLVTGQQVLTQKIVLGR